MKKLISITLLVTYFFLLGCSEENPKTQNELLRDKKISWSASTADYYELVADGTFIAVGGDFPQEGCMRGIWESMSEDGDFKIIPDFRKPHTYLVAKMESPLGKGAVFTLDSYREGKEVEASEKKYKVTGYENIQKSHLVSAVRSEAISYITRYADDVYVLELHVQDEYGLIKKVFTQGDAITTESMVTNGKKWMNSPPIVLPQGWKSYQRARTVMTILYHNGQSDKATFLTTGYRDKSGEIFDDAWF